MLLSAIPMPVQVRHYWQSSQYPSSKDAMNPVVQLLAESIFLKHVIPLWDKVLCSEATT